MIPKILHFFFGMSPKDRPWGLTNYVCVKSAIERLKPYEANFYYQYEPTGPWWEKTKVMLQLTRIEAPQEIFGRPLLHVAHKSDVARLKRLIAVGGIYLDCDVLIQRSFDEILGGQVVMGREFGSGLCNAVILAAPGAPFLMRWLESYRTFRSRGADDFWNEHSIQMPLKLAAEHPSEITILDCDAFFNPTWRPDDIEKIFNSNQDIASPNTFANHLWENRVWRKYLRHLTPRQVRSRSTNFHNWCLPLLFGLEDDFGKPTRSQVLRSHLDELNPQTLLPRVTGKLRRLRVSQKRT